MAYIHEQSSHLRSCFYLDVCMLTCCKKSCVSSAAAVVLDPADELNNKRFSICGIHCYKRFNLPTIIVSRVKFFGGGMLLVFCVSHTAT